MRTKDRIAFYGPTADQVALFARMDCVGSPQAMLNWQRDEKLRLEKKYKDTKRSIDREVRTLERLVHSDREKVDSLDWGCVDRLRDEHQHLLARGDAETTEHRWLS